MAVYTAKLNRPPHHPTLLAYHAPNHYAFFYDIVRLFSFFDTETKIVLPSRVRIVIAANTILSVHSCRKLYARTVIRLIYQVPLSIAVCVIRVGFIALFCADLQSRMCASLRFLFLNVIVVCSSSSSHQRTIYTNYFQ